MQTSLIIVVLSSLLALFIPATAMQITPLPPNTALATSTDTHAAQETVLVPQESLDGSTLVDHTPATLAIPSIQLNANVLAIGITHSGELDVPDGKTKDVGWYKDGTVPGTQGSAVIDAHVFAAFNKLRYVKIGDDVYVTSVIGEKLHYKVQSSMVYKLEEVPLDLLFNRSDGKYLNLITCAGKLTSDRSTYDHRLIVYATLVN